MIPYFLRAKHWQLFVLIVGIPLIFQNIIIATTFGGFSENISPVTEFFIPLILVAPVWILSLLLSWLYSVGAGLQAKVPVDLRRPVRFFKVTLIFPAIYVFLIMLFAAGPMTSILATTIGGGLTVFIVLTLHLFAMFCIMYCLYFAVKTIKLAQKQQPVSFSDFLGEFFLIGFFPLGIWIIQPKVNELVQRTSSPLSEEEFV